MVDWCSRKLRLVARASLAAEIQDACDGEGEQATTRLVLAGMMGQHIDVLDVSGSIGQLLGIMIMDCWSLSDAVARQENFGLVMGERRSGIEPLSLRQLLRSCGTRLLETCTATSC